MTISQTTKAAPSEFDEYVMRPHMMSPHTARKVNAYIRNTAQVLTRVDRTLARSSTIKVVSVPLANSDWAMRTNNWPSMGPAFSRVDNGQVFIDFTHISFLGADERQHIAHTLGLNYHELAHQLFTPRMSASNRYRELYAVVTSGDYRKIAFNYLEDGRIERMLIAKYASTRAFLTVSFLAMLRVSKTPESAWFYVAPRIGEQPREVTDAVSAAIKQMSKSDRAFSDRDLKRVEKIASEYKRLAFTSPNKIKRAAELVEQFAMIIEQQHDASKQPQEGNHSNPQMQDRIKAQIGGRASYARQSDTVSEEEQQECQDKRDQDEKSEERERRRAEREAQEQSDEDESEDESGEQGSSGEAESDEDESEAGSGGSATDDDGDEPQSGAQGHDDEGDTDDGEHGSDEDENDGEGEEGSQSGRETDTSSDDDTPGGNAAGGAGKVRDFDTAQAGVEEAIAEALAETLASESASQDIESHRRGLRGHMIYTLANKLDAAMQQPVTPEMRLASKKVAKAFLPLQSKLDPGWNKRTSSGRLNVSRFLQERDLEEAFDTWREDRSEAMDVEIVLLCDLSSSMSGYKITQTSITMWVLRSALQSIDAKVTGIGFESGEHLLFERHEKAAQNNFPVWGARGGTSLIEAIESAAVIMSRSRSKAKALVCITDGDISRGFEETLTEIRESGVHCSKFGIYGGGYASTTHDNLFDLNVTVGNPAEIIDPVKQIVKGLITRKAGVR